MFGDRPRRSSVVARHSQYGWSDPSRGLPSTTFTPLLCPRRNLLHGRFLLGGRTGGRRGRRHSGTRCRRWAAGGTRRNGWGWQSGRLGCHGRSGRWRLCCSRCRCRRQVRGGGRLCGRDWSGWWSLYAHKCSIAVFLRAACSENSHGFHRARDMPEQFGVSQVFVPLDIGQESSDPRTDLVIHQVGGLSNICTVPSGDCATRVTNPEAGRP